MTIQEELRTPEIRALRERYHELHGYWVGYHWECFGSMEEFKAYLRKEIAAKEKEMEEQNAQDHP